MKKVLQRCHSWLLMLVAMFAMSISAMAQDVTIYPADAETKDGVSVAGGYVYYGAYWLMEDVMTISAPEGKKFTHILIKDHNDWKVTEVSANEGSMTNSKALHDWTGEAVSLTFTNEENNSWGVSEIQVWLEDASNGGEGGGEPKSNEFVTEGKAYTLTAVTKNGVNYAWTVTNGQVEPIMNATPTKFICEFHGDNVAFVTEDGKYLRNHDCVPSNATWYDHKSATGLDDTYNELCNLVFEHFPSTGDNIDPDYSGATADLVAIKAARGYRTDNGNIAEGYFILNSDGSFSGAATTSPFFKDAYTSAFRLEEATDNPPVTEPGTFAITGATNDENEAGEVEAISYVFAITAANNIVDLNEGNITLTDADEQPVGGNAYVYGYEGEGGASTVYARFTFDTEDHNLHAAGTYTLNVPAGMFEDAEGNLSEAYSATWTIKAPEPDAYDTTLTVAAGEGSSSLTDKINIGDKEYNTYKIGTGSKSGSINVTIPAGSYGMSFYALSWNTAETTVTATAGEKSKEYTATGAGISGNSPYTYDAEKGGEVDTHLYTFGYTEALAEDVTVTLSAPARIIFFGINALTEAAQPEPEPEPEPEVTFPEENKAYVLLNNDAKLYLNIVADADKAARLTATPEKIFFEKKGEGFIIKDEEGNMIGGHEKGWNISSTIEQTWNIVEVEGGYALQRTDDESKYIGFDKIVVNPDDATATAAFRDKKYAEAHGVFTIFEYTFPLTHGVAYKVKNVDAGLYMNINSAADKYVSIAKTPQEIYFTAAEEGGFYIHNQAGEYIGAGANDWTIGNTQDAWNVVEVEGGYAFQRTDAPSKHLGLDSESEGSSYFRDKGAANHYAHLIMLFDTPESTPQEDLQAAIDAAKAVTAEDYAEVPEDLFDDLAAEIKKAEALAAKEDAAVSDINAQIAALEAAVKAITEYTEPSAEELAQRLADALAAAAEIVAENTVGGENKAGLPGYKPADLVAAIAADLEKYAETPEELTRDMVVAVEHNIRDYNNALPCIPEVGKTYLIRNHNAGHYSYVITAGENGRELIDYNEIPEIENKHLWTVSEHNFVIEDDWGDPLFEEMRYVFTNVATGQIFGFDGAKLDLCETETDMNCWYFTQKTPKDIFAGSAPLPYGALGLQYNDGSNKYKYATVDMRKSDLNITGSDLLMHALWNTYSSAFIFEPYEPEVPTTFTIAYNEGQFTVTPSKSDVTYFCLLTSDAVNTAEEYETDAEAFAGDVEYITDADTEVHTGTYTFAPATIFNAWYADTDWYTADYLDQHPGEYRLLVGEVKYDATAEKWVAVGEATSKTINLTTVGISIITTDAAAKVYDIQGRRVVAPAKGLYIQNGVKVVR